MKRAIIKPELVVKIKSHFNITKNEKTWLEAVWNHMNTNYSFPEYRQVRGATVSKTKPDFNPRRIDPLLVTERNDLYIRLLGLIIINPKDEVFENGLKLILEVKRQMIEDADKIEFTLLELSKKLNVDFHKLNLSFKIFSDFFSMWNSCGSSNLFANSIQTDYFKIERESNQDFYLNFRDLNQSISEKFENLTKEFSVDPLALKINPQLKDSNTFIESSRLKELEQINSSKFDFSKLIQLTREIELSFSNENYYACALLQRALIDHVPPLFGFNTFNEVVNNYKSDGNSKSFKKSMEHLGNSLRAIGDSSIHSQIRNKEVLPNSKQVDFSSDIDVLLSEIIRIMK